MTTLERIAVVGTDTVQHRRRVAESVNNILDFSFDQSRIQSEAEKLAGINPINLSYPPGNLLRYGAIPNLESSEATKIANNTKAIQTWIDYLCATHSIGYAPLGRFLFDGTIQVPGTYGWGWYGAGRTATAFIQTSNNIQMFDLGATAGSGLHSFSISDCGFDYLNSQASSNTNANAIKFSVEAFQSSLRRLQFNGGSWAIRVASGVGGPWGANWDDLIFGVGLTGGAMDWTGAVNAVPNNKWGRFFVTATNMTGPIFKNIKGYNWTWDTVELIDLNNAQWISLQAGSILVMGALKMEVGEYSGSPSFDGSALIYAPSGTILINSLTIGGTTAEFDFGAPRTVFAVTSGTFKVEAFHTELTAAPVDFYIADVDSSSLAEIRYTLRGTYPVPYTYVGGSASAEYLTVYPDINTHLSADKGDANYTITNGDPSTIFFETTLTAARTVALPNTDGIVFNGLRYKVISNGAVNGANTIAVKYGGSTLHTLSADNTSVEVMWRRGTGWLVSALGTVP